MDKFPVIVVTILSVWIVLGVTYLILKWRQRGKNTYIIPRVFVLCSPRTVQFHYELILRVGLSSPDFNPDKHDIDITVLGMQKNEVVPMTRLNTKTLLDEPLITSLSIVAYRLVEMPALGGLILKHSGPFKSWIYVYDFTVIDLSTNKEYYYTINQYIGSFSRTISLDEPNKDQEVHYPIDDVPLPHWFLEDVMLIIFAVINFIMLSFGLLPIACSWTDDIICIMLATIGGGSALFSLAWLLHYQLRWNRDRKEYFNQYDSSGICSTENLVRMSVALVSATIGLGGLYLGSQIVLRNHQFVWLLCVSNCVTLVVGFWNIARQLDVGESVVAMGLSCRGIETVGTGMRYADLISEQRSTSASDEGGSTISTAGSKKGTRSFGPRSSVKSFGFDPKNTALLSSASGVRRARSHVMSRVPTSSVMTGSPTSRVSFLNSLNSSTTSVASNAASNTTLVNTPVSDRLREKSSSSSKRRRQRLSKASRQRHSSSTEHPSSGHHSK